MEQQSEGTRSTSKGNSLPGGHPVETANRFTPQQSCSSCAATFASPASPSWIYAIGSIEPRFPSLAIEKEYAQLLGRGDMSGLTDRQALRAVLSQPESRYLARRMCWVMTIEGLETYLLYPRDPTDLSLLVEAVRPNPAATDLDVIIGSKGPLAPPEACNALQIPIVIIDQVYSMERDTLVSCDSQTG